MDKIRLSSGFLAKDFSRISVMHDIWNPWDEESEIIMGYYISGINDLSTKFSKVSIAKYSNHLKDFSTQIGICGPDIFHNLYPDEIDDYDDVSSAVRWNALPDDYHELNIALKIECSIRTGLLEEYEASSDAEKRRILKGIEHDFSLVICNLNMALAIAKPGAFQVSASRTSENRFHSVNNFSKFWYTVPTHIKEIGWPNFRNLPTELVWKWLSSQPGVLRGRSKTPVSRSICIFSRLFRSHYTSDELQDVVWSISGIECLLGENGRSIVGSIREKLKLIFPDIDSAQIDIDRTIKKLYQLRSALVHGGQNIFSNYNIISDFDKTSEADMGEVFAASVLVCLLQTAFTRKIDCFEFDYILR